jgi:hypothetical protein
VGQSFNADVKKGMEKDKFLGHNKVLVHLAE